MSNRGLCHLLICLTCKYGAYRALMDAKLFGYFCMIFEAKHRAHITHLFIRQKTLPTVLRPMNNTITLVLFRSGPSDVSMVNAGRVPASMCRLMSIGRSFPVDKITDKTMRWPNEVHI